MKFNSICFIIVFLFSPIIVFTQNEVPLSILNKVEKYENTDEFLKALDFYCEPMDSLKFKALCFLIDNMNIHETKTYYWVDSLKNEIAFDELEFSNFRESIRAFDDLKKEKGKLKPIPIIKKDVENIEASFLINNIEKAFKIWSSTKYDFNTFCEYILPYRVSVEPLYDWRTPYNGRFSKIIDTENMSTENIIEYLTSNINLWFVCTYDLEKRSEPLPRLGALQLLHRKKGYCEDVAALSVFALRSLGIPSTVDFVPYWGTSSGGHALNCAFDQKGNPIHFDVLLRSDSLHEFIREPAKVFRTTFSSQLNSLANNLDIENIPPNFLRETNYIDVTHEYWQTSDVKCKLDNKQGTKNVVYACVFNKGKWKPVWWGKKNGDKVNFSNMSKGVVYLPKYFVDGKMITAGYPVALGYKHTIELKPSKETHTVRIKELSGYLKFRPGKKYKLLYYDYGWKHIETRRADENTKELIIPNVPKNALLLLAPNYGEKKERPFIFTEDGKRLWW